MKTIVIIVEYKFYFSMKYIKKSTLLKNLKNSD